MRPRTSDLDVDRALARTRQTLTVEGAIVRMEIIQGILAEMFKPGKSNAEEWERLRDAAANLRRNLVQYTEQP